MIIDKNKKVELAVSDDKTRQVLSQCWYDSERELLQATNGRMLVQIAVKKSEGDVSGFIRVDSLKEGRKTKCNAFELKATDKIESIEQRKTYNRETPDTLGIFPKVDQVIPSKDRKEICITLNPEMLMDVAKGLGASKSITIYFYPDDVLHPFVILKNGESRTKYKDIGVLMPMKNLAEKDGEK